jgi:hypothetical protein
MKLMRLIPALLIVVLHADNAKMPTTSNPSAECLIIMAMTFPGGG